MLSALSDRLIRFSYLYCLLSCLVYITRICLCFIPECWQVLTPTRKETSWEACQGRARFQQHRDASCYQDPPPPQDKAPKEIHAILTETLVCFFPGRAKGLSAKNYNFKAEVSPFVVNDGMEWQKTAMLVVEENEEYHARLYNSGESERDLNRALPEHKLSICVLVHDERRKLTHT